MTSRTEFTHRTLIAIGLVSLTGLVVATIVVAADVLLVMFGGILLAVFFSGLADVLARHTKLTHGGATFLVIATTLLALGVVGWVLAADISAQLDQLGSDVTRLWREAMQRLKEERWGRQLLLLLSFEPGTVDVAENARSSIAIAFSTTLGALVNLLIVLFLGIYLACNPDGYRRGLLRLIPPAQRPEASEILQSIAQSLRWWLFGRAVGMSIVGVITGIGLSLLNVPLALGLGFVAAVFDFVPFVGPLVAAAPALLVASSGGASQIAYVALLYAGVQLFEGYLLTPLIEQRSVKLPPALTIGGQVVSGVLVGPVGVVFATPVLAVAVLIVKRIYVEETIESTLR